MWVAYLRQEVKGHLRVDVPLFRLKKDTVKKVIFGPHIDNSATTIQSKTCMNEEKHLFSVLCSSVNPKHL